MAMVLHIVIANIQRCSRLRQLAARSLFRQEALAVLVLELYLLQQQRAFLHHVTLGVYRQALVRVCQVAIPTLHPIQ